MSLLNGDGWWGLLVDRLDNVRGGRDDRGNEVFRNSDGLNRRRMGFEMFRRLGYRLG